MYSRFIGVVALVLTTIAGFSQEIRFVDAPEFYQLYARDKTDSAEVKVAGHVRGEADFSQLALKVFKDGLLYDTQTARLTNKQFSLSTRIHSGLHQFKFELYVKKNNADSLCFAADSVVCGDAYIISGQSNSHASSIFSTFSSPYCRSFGVKTGYEAYNEADKEVRWGRASGNCPGLKKGGGWFMKNKFGVGAWGMELMRLIVERYQIPVCIINGGSGSSSIAQNMLYPEQPSLETSFGRLAYRVNQAGLKDQVKAILWHQGETDSDERYQDYASNFDILLKDWKRVYPGLEKIYLFQLHQGCGGDYQSEMREIQRQIAHRYEMIDIMSTTGVVGHDGCHFSYEGYGEFAQRICPLLGRDFYGDKATYSITPPDLINASYLSENKIVLTFDQPIGAEENMEVKGKVHELKDQFFFRKEKDGPQDGAVVKDLQIRNKQIILTLKEASDYQYMTYLPGHYYAGTKKVYEGPWVVGSQNNLGALSFDRVPVNSATRLAKKATEWHGYQMLDSTLNGINFKLVFPKVPNKKRDWIWRARFWGHEPQTDLALLEKGFHVAYIEVGGLFGNEKAMEIWDSFYEMVTRNYQLNKKVVLEGMSRGGLIIFNWGNRNAEKVACIYGDAPVCDFKSWPGGKGQGIGSPKTWITCLKQYGFSEDMALLFNGNPVNHMENIARFKVPILNVVGDADKVVPVAENTDVLEKRLNALGWELNVIHKPGVGHHPHSLEDPKAIVSFILTHTGNR